MHNTLSHHFCMCAKQSIVEKSNRKKNQGLLTFRIVLGVLFSTIFVSCDFNPTEKEKLTNELERINDSISTKKIDSLSFENGKAWYSNGELVKMSFHFGQDETFSKDEEFYLKNDTVFAVFKRAFSKEYEINYKSLILFKGEEVIHQELLVDGLSVGLDEYNKELTEETGVMENQAYVDDFSGASYGVLTAEVLLSRNDIELADLKKNSEQNESLKDFRDIQLQLIGSTEKMSDVYLGEPDVNVTFFGHVNKNFSIYYDIVKNPNGPPKHLVLFLRRNPKYIHDDIEEIYAISDNEKACFGIHCLMIRNHEIYTDALNLVHDGYKQLPSN